VSGGAGQCFDAAAFMHFTLFMVDFLRFRGFGGEDFTMKNGKSMKTAALTCTMFLGAFA
jgi:hypothetical protein